VVKEIDTMPERNQKLNKMYSSLLKRGKDPYTLMTPEQLELAGGYLPAVYQANPGYTAGGPGAAGDALETAATKGRFFKEGGAFDKNNGGGIGNFISTIGSPELDYNWKPVVDPTTGKRTTGLQAWGKNIGGAYNIGNIALQSYKAAQGLGDISDARKASKDVASDIVLSAANSPTIGYDLNADQKRLLRELQRGTYESNLNLGDVDLLGALGGGVKGALSGAPGGLPGVIIGGIGGLTNSVIGDLGDSAARDNAELEALYQAVLESEQYHNQMRKQRAYAGLY
jgi:hypothetical protein